MVQTDLVQDLQRLYAWSTSSATTLFLSFAGLVVLAHLVPFLANWHLISTPGPIFAKFSDFWLLFQAKRGDRFQVVHELHKKHGEHPIYFFSFLSRSGSLCCFQASLSASPRITYRSRRTKPCNPSTATPQEQ